VRADQRLGTRGALELGISSGSSQAILNKDFGMTYVSAKFIPWLLTLEHCISVVSDLLKCAEAKANFFKNV
jgi:hypothetical protein